MTCKWCLIGVPDHQGVAIVGGRIGAAAGPAAFRRHLQRLKSERPVREELIDFGDVEKLTSDIEGNHQKAAEKIRNAHRECQFSVVVGGGHDHGYSHLLGIHRHLQKTHGSKARLGCINIDAHLDLRAPAMWKGKLTPSSGSPFYLAITQQILAPECLVEFGIQTHANGPELWDFARTRGIQVIPFEKLRFGEAIVYFREALCRLASRCDQIVISLDLDAAAEAFAPGVSAPQAEGFTSSELMQMLEDAGREPKVLSLGLFELNPEVDQGEKTSRLAATLAYHFAHAKLLGLS